MGTRVDETVVFSDFWKYANLWYANGKETSIKEFYYNLKPVKISVDKWEVTGLMGNSHKPHIVINIKDK